MESLFFTVTTLSILFDPWIFRKARSEGSSAGIFWRSLVILLVGSQFIFMVFVILKIATKVN